MNKSWSYTFEWQEKKFSPREIFSLGPEKKGLDKMLYKRNQVEVGYHKQLTRLKNNGVDITPSAGVVISSKVDKDGFVPKEEKSAITSSRRGKTEIGDAVVHFSARTGSKSVSTAKTRLKREKFDQRHADRRDGRYRPRRPSGKKWQSPSQGL